LDGLKLIKETWVDERGRNLRCLDLKTLPLTPEHGTGWPWVYQNSGAPETASDGSEWPKISVITPSYNQGEFIEETIRSVLLQGYPNLEYIVIDGGSSDNSVGIIKKYEPWLSCMISEPDQGQADAINKGFALATGEILAWLNSDDTYAPDALWTAGDFLTKHPAVGMVYSDCRIVDEDGAEISTWQSKEFSFAAELCFPNLIPQPTVFFRRTVMNEAGFLNTRLHYAFDYEFWLRIGLLFNIKRIRGISANFRSHSRSKTVSEIDRFWPEVFQVLNTVFSSALLPVDLKALKKKAVSNVYFEMALQYYREYQNFKAAKTVMKSIKHNPWQLIRLVKVNRLRKARQSA